MKLIIPLALAAVVAIVLSTIVIRKRRKARANVMRSAAVLMREGRLDHALARDNSNLQNRMRPVLQVSWKDEKKRSYVLDPTEIISIGRDPSINQISIRQDTVSAQHCRLMLHNGKLTIQDMNSANGTWIKRKYGVYPVNGRIYLRNGDSIIIGEMEMQIKLFMFDTAYI